MLTNTACINYLIPCVGVFVCLVVALCVCICVCKLFLGGYFFQKVLNTMQSKVLFCHVFYFQSSLQIKIPTIRIVLRAKLEVGRNVFT